jgi:predicted nucleic acid-binding protein
VVHVFVETNWVVDYAAPSHRQNPAARGLLERARKGDLTLHLPALCLVEARRAIRSRFQPRGEADAIRKFVRWATSAGKLTIPERDTVMRTVDMFESRVRGELDNLNSTLESLRSEPGVEVFALNDNQLRLAVDLCLAVDLDPFDQSVLAAVLGRAETIRTMNPRAEIASCELDGDLQPWDKQGRARTNLTELYDPRAIWVYGDFDMSAPVRPPHCQPR